MALALGFIEIEPALWHTSVWIGKDFGVYVVKAVWESMLYGN